MKPTKAIFRTFRPLWCEEGLTPYKSRWSKMRDYVAAFGLVLGIIGVVSAVGLTILSYFTTGNPFAWVGIL